MRAPDGPKAVTVLAAWLAVVLAALAIVVAVVLHGLSGRRQERLDETQRQQADAIAELLRIQKARAGREAEQEAEAARLEEEEEQEAAEHTLSAQLSMSPLWPRPDTGQMTKIINGGPHAALLYEAEVWGPEKEHPTNRCKLQIGSDGIRLERGESHRMPIKSVPAGQAWCRLAWEDGRGGWETVEAIELLAGAYEHTWHGAMLRNMNGG